MSSLFSGIESVGDPALLCSYGVSLHSLVGGGVQHFPQLGVIVFLGHNDCSIVTFLTLCDFLCMPIN